MDGRNIDRAKARMIVLFIFVIGFAAGALSMNLYKRATASEPEEIKKYENPQDYLIEKMSKDLSLTVEQQKQIKPVLDDTFSQYREIRSEMQPQMKAYEARFDAVRQKSRERIRAMLSEEQLPKFEEWQRDQDARREKYRERFKK